MAVRKTDTAFFAAIALLVGSALYAVPVSFFGYAAVFVVTGLLVFAGLTRKVPSAAYAASFASLLVYTFAFPRVEWQAAVWLDYVFGLIFAILHQNPLYSLGAGLVMASPWFGGYETVRTDTLVFIHAIVAGHPFAAAWIVRFMAKLSKERNEYRQLSMIDSLTGLASLQRTLLFGQELIEAGKRVRVLLIDFNFFKQINDKYGHLVGNKMIIAFAEQLKALLQDANGIIGRLGGDEFVIVLEDEERFAELRQTILDRLNGKTYGPDEDLPPLELFFCVGEAVSDPKNTSHIEEVLHDADLNMYAFKLHHRVPLIYGLSSDLIEHNPDPIFTFDLKGNLLGANPAAERFLGYTSAQLAERHVMGFIHHDDRELALRSFEQAVGGHLSETELRLIHKDGNLLFVHVTNIPVIIDNQLVGVYAIAKDISERLHNSDMLSAMRQIAASITHEMRRPMIALNGFLQLLQARISNEYEYYPIILHELEHINLIVNKYAMLSDPHTVHFRKHDIVDILLYVIGLLDDYALMHNVHFRTEFDSESMSIECDERQIKQLFVNLIKNAVESMPDGGEVVVRLQLLEDGVGIRITDQGDGTFGSTFRFDDPLLATRPKGVGVGLMICEQIVKNHRGTISVSGEPGRGSTVFVKLPS